MNGTYHILPLGIGLPLAYLFSLAFINLGILRLSTHRKVWNTLLLVAFLVTASLGVFLAIQVNYKLNFKAEDIWMLLHVDFGISLAIIAIFHLTWHLGYYLKLFSGKKKKESEPEDFTTAVDKPITDISFSDRLPLLALGFTALVTQLVLLRAFLSVFQGNELVFGVILGNWMILTGLGAWLGKFSYRMNHPAGFLQRNLIWLGILPLVTAFLLFFLKNIVFVPGSLAGLMAVFLGSLILLSPFCLLSGYSFTFYTSSLSNKYRSNLIGQAYALESFGSLAGGVLFTFILVFFLKTMQVLGLVLIINAAAAIILYRNKKKSSGKWIMPVLLGSLGFATLILPADRFSRHFLYPNQEIRFQKETPFGSLVITRMGDQMNFYENNVLITNTLNITENEENVHYALLQRPHPEKVLIISGGISGIIPEIEKYSVQQIDYVEINPWIIRTGRRITNDLDQKNVNVIIKDARRYVPVCKEKYDAILINLPPPLTAQLNRYYTREFFTQLSKILDPSGVVSLSLPASPNYTGREGADINSLMYATLKEVFSQVTILPGEKNYFLASGAPLHLDIARLVRERGINNTYVSEYYIQDDLLQARNQLIMDRLQPVEKVNTDLRPVAYFRQISLWLSYYKFKTKILLGALGLLFLYLLIRSVPVSTGMFAGGFAASSVEILVLFSFQILYGYVYWMSGVIITLFIASLAAGALAKKPFGKGSPDRGFTRILVLTGTGVFLLPLLILLLKSMVYFQAAGQLLLLIYTFLIAFLTGRLFKLGSGIMQGPTSRVSASLYGYDLAGGALGALVVSGLLLPLTGIVNTALITGSLCLVTAGYVTLRRR